MFINAYGQEFPIEISSIQNEGDTDEATNGHSAHWMKGDGDRMTYRAAAWRDDATLR